MIFEHIRSVKVKAIFSQDLKFRYQLIITKKDLSNSKTVCTIMQNPSVANEEEADKSVQFLEKLIFEKSYSLFNNVNKLIIVNQYAFIQTNDFSPNKYSVGKDNDVHIKDAIKQSQIILIAWGSNNEYYERQETILKILSSFKDKEIYKTKKHPSRGFYKDFIFRYSL